MIRTFWTTQTIDGIIENQEWSGCTNSIRKDCEVLGLCAGYWYNASTRKKKASFKKCHKLSVEIKEVYPRRMVTQG